MLDKARTKPKEDDRSVIGMESSKMGLFGTYLNDYGKLNKFIHFDFMIRNQINS